MKKQILLLIMTTFLLTGTILPVLADGPLVNARYYGTGKYSTVAAGVGMVDYTSATINIDVPGTQVIAAFLYWAGFDVSPGGDNTIEFQGDTLVADEQFGPEFWKEIYYTYVFVADVTENISTGANSYEIAELTMHENYGAGLIVVYEDLSLPQVNEVTILDGIDSFYFELEDPYGPDSSVTCLQFDGVPYDRDVQMTLIVGGTEHDDRPNEIWTATGTDLPTPEDLIAPPSTAESAYPYPLEGSDGRSWDTYTDMITVPADDEWLCVQIESIVSYRDGPDNAGLGDSAVLAAAGFVVPLAAQEGKVTGGGQIPIGDDKKETATYGFNAMATSKDPGVKGELQYLDHTTGMLVHAHIVNSLTVWEELVGNKPWPLRKAMFSGPCTVDHQDGFYFKAYVEDNGEPGKADYFSIKVFDANGLVYEAGSTIINGNIQIHKP